MKMKIFSILLLLSVVGFLFFHSFQRNEKEESLHKQNIFEKSDSTTYTMPEGPGSAAVLSESKQLDRMPSRPESKRSSASSTLRKSLLKVEPGAAVPWLTDTPWKLWRGITAIKKNQGRSMDTKVLGEVNGFFLVEDKNEKENLLFSSDQPFVVVDPRLNSVGVVSGVFTVTLKEGASADFLLRNQELRIRESFPEIRTYYITSAEEPFDLEQLRKFLLSESNIESVKIEVLSRQYEKY